MLKSSLQGGRKQYIIIFSVMRYWITYKNWFLDVCRRFASVDGLFFIRTSLWGRLITMESHRQCNLILVANNCLKRCYDLQTYSWIIDRYQVIFIITFYSTRLKTCVYIEMLGRNSIHYTLTAMVRCLSVFKFIFTNTLWFFVNFLLFSHLF